ncbi:MAG: hypothetical protein RMM51_09480 [Verrucomicrobiae bacterium]|nr:hypothetical protein [Verrucomicrobiae bacterium]
MSAPPVFGLLDNLMASLCVELDTHRGLESPRGQPGAVASAAEDAACCPVMILR